MKNMVIHPLTRRQLDSFMSAPTQTLILAGPVGSGKATLARSLATKLLDISSLDDYPYNLIINSGKGSSIGIESVRQLEHFLGLKVPRQAEYNRAVLIEDADRLTLEAQNALLKTLEEPPAATLIVLCASSEQALLPTVRSRANLISVKPPEPGELKAYFEAKGFNKSGVDQAYAISGGLPGLMRALLEDEEHPLLRATQQARQILQAQQYERLMLVDELTRQKDLARDTVFILQQMAHVSLQKATGKSAQRWQAILKAAFQASEQLHVNAQPKLVLTELCLSF